VHAEPVHPVQVCNEPPPGRQVGVVQSLVAAAQLQPPALARSQLQVVVAKVVDRGRQRAVSIALQSVVAAGALPQPVAGAQVGVKVVYTLPTHSAAGVAQTTVLGVPVGSQVERVAQAGA